jgi:hypothetical protein
VDLSAVSATTLSTALQKFYCEAVPKGSKELYHKNSLISIRSAINRQLANFERNVDIVRDKTFKTANGVLDGLLKERTRTGTSLPTQHKAIIETDDLDKIATYLRRSVNQSPIALRHLARNAWLTLLISID